MEDNCACDLYFCEEIEVSEYEECLALILIVQPHVLLEHEQVILHVRVAATIHDTVA